MTIMRRRRSRPMASLVLRFPYGNVSHPAERSSIRPRVNAIASSTCVLVACELRAESAAATLLSGSGYAECLPTRV